MGRPFDPGLIAEAEESPAYTVSEINALAKQALERNFRSVHVVGEISNLHIHTSGHVYFSLKDHESQLDCAMWRGAASQVRFELEDGMEVLAFGDLTLYTRRGRYQMSVRGLEPRGVGALEVAFRQLCGRLEKEGLFEEAHKKELPFLPGRIALVTSASGAAVKDMLKSIYDRFSRARVGIFPVKVQGEGAAEEIAGAIRLLNRAGGFDVIVIGRGGGSIEDLWAFNEEAVARAVYESRVPVVTAVGHERDITIADLVADARAMTPTGVGGLVAPDEKSLLERLDGARRSLTEGLRRRAERAREALAFAWRHPVFSRPETMLLPLAQRLDSAGDRFRRGMDEALKNRGERLKRALVALESLNPLAVLARGYSVTRDESGAVITDAAQAGAGDIIETLLSKGGFRSRVIESEDGERESRGQES